MTGTCRLAYAELVDNKQIARTVNERISMLLRRKVFQRVLQPFKNLKTAIARERLEGQLEIDVTPPLAPNFAPLRLYLHSNIVNTL